MKAKETKVKTNFEADALTLSQEELKKAVGGIDTVPLPDTPFVSYKPFVPYRPSTVWGRLSIGTWPTPE
jgi:hypothetical protein